MSSIDDRIVNMQFDNASFEKGIAQSTKSLADLNDALQLPQATTGFDDAQDAANSFSLANIEDSLDNVASHFSILGAAAFTVVNDITNSALDAGKKIAGSIIDPLVQGGAKRALAIQQAQFQFQGLGLNIQDTMNAALDAVRGTSFGLDEAATAAAQFGASGITAANGLSSVLRSVAGVAAQTGSSYSNIANIFETIAGNGRLMGDQLNQLSSYGVNAAAVLAKSLGTTEANVRDLTSQGKISFQQFSDAMNGAFGANAAKANETYAGALANMHAALARIGADVASPYFLGMRDIFNALGPAFDTIHTAIQPFLDDLGALATAHATGLVNIINTVIAAGLPQVFTNIVNSIIKFQQIIGGAFKEIFPEEAVVQLAAVVRFLQDLTAALVPGTKAADELQRTFAGFFAIIDIGIQIVSGLVNMIFNLLGFATQGSGGFLTFTARIGDWLVKVDQAIKQGTFLTDFFKGLQDVLEVPIGIFKILVGVLGSVIDMIGEFNTSGLTAGLDAFGDDLKTRFSGLVDLGNIIDGFFAGIAAAAEATWNFMKPFFQWVSEAITAAVSVIKQVLSGISFEDALQTINTGLFAGLIVIVKKFTDYLGTIFSGGGDGLVGTIKKVFGALTDNLKALQAKTNAETLEKIAIAVALLAASVVALSLIDTVKMAGAISAIAALMGSLIGVFAAFNAIAGGTGIKGTAKITALALSLDLIAGAMLVLAGAVAILAALPFDRLSAAIGAMVVLLGALVGALATMSKIGPGVIIGAAAISILAPAIVLLASALAILAAIPFDSLATALGGLAVALGILIGTLWSINAIGPRVLIGVAAIALLAPAMVVLASAIAILAAIPLTNLALGLGAMVIAMAALVGVLWAVNAIGPGVLFAAAAVGAVAVSIAILAGSVAIFGAMDTGALIQGMIALAAAMVILVGGILLLSLAGPEVIIGAAAMVVAAVAITILTGALKIMATMSWDDIGRSMVVMAGSLILLAAAMLVMGNPLVALGAVALIVAATAMMILAPALKIMGSMSWDSIGRGLAVLGAALAILAVGGLLLIPASVGFLLFGAAMLLLGEGLKLAGEGAGLLAIAIAALVVAGTAGLALLGVAIDLFVSKLPELGAGFGAAIVAMVVTIGAEAPLLITAFVNILLAMLDAVDQVVPRIIEVATDIIVALIAALVILVPDIVNAGLTILLAVVTGIADNIGQITDQALNIMINFLNAIASKIPAIITAAGNVVLSFINGLGDYIRTHSQDFVTAGSKLFRAIVDGVSDAIAAGGSDLRYAGQKIGNALLQGAKNALGINSPSKAFRDDVMPSVFEGIEDGNDKNISRAEDAGTQIGSTITDSAIDTVKKSISGISDVFDTSLTAPTIRPVLDLSAVKAGVSTIPSLLPTPSISLGTTNDVATSVSLQDQAKNAQLSVDATVPATPTNTINFTQNNTSPKALTTTEIYRQTKNQLSTLEGDLGVVDQSGSS